jgi:hypothetical protein
MIVTKLIVSKMPWSERYEPPAEFQDAKKKYQYDSLFEPGHSLRAIWNQLANWRRFGEHFPKQCDPERLRQARIVEGFKQSYLHAIFENDIAAVERILDAMRLKECPKSELTAIRATIEAFDRLFCRVRIETIRANWPTKGQVKREATKILEAKGHTVPEPENWPPIWKAAGLKDLPSGRPGRPSKAKKSS